MFDPDAKAVTAQALELIEADGSDLSQPLEMDFFIAVPSQQSGEQIAEEARKIGFETSVEQDEESGEWTCYCTKTILASVDTVFDIEETLDDLAEPFGGYSDGFGTFGNKDEE
ncbi:ribonuclease E inhibitor RraB [Bremerella sp. JC817]|uniref:ribonuclease E inhibitor RraB n=1 Tax=Bremerella sp. JC817 TaxID=3231756 RepID=UPI003458D103